MLNLNEAMCLSEPMYLSTSTFANPTFDVAQLEQQQQQQTSATAAPLPNHQSETTQDDASHHNITNPPQQQQQREQRSSFRQRCTQARDDLVFAIKSKVFVLELNLKRRLRALKNFADAHLSSWVVYSFQQQCPNQSGKCKPGYSSIIDEVATKQPRNEAAAADENDYDADEQFWRRSISPVAESLSALGQQQERILARLEQHIAAKRRLEQLQEQRKQSRLFAACEFVASQLVSSSSSPADLAAEATVIDGRKYCRSTKASTDLAKRAGCFESVRDVRAPNRPCRIGSANPLQDELDVYDEHDEKEDRKLCVVCYAKEPNIMTLPCEHDEICSDCFIEIIYRAIKSSKFPLHCVVCRQKVQRVRGGRAHARNC